MGSLDIYFLLLNMADTTTYISINTKSRQAKKLLELLETLPFAKVIQQPNATTKKAMTDAKKGKTKKHTSSKALFEALTK
jgi:hypothetical protein